MQVEANQIMNNQSITVTYNLRIQYDTVKALSRVELKCAIYAAKPVCSFTGSNPGRKRKKNSRSGTDESQHESLASVLLSNHRLMLCKEWKTSDGRAGFKKLDWKSYFLIWRFEKQ